MAGIRTERERERDGICSYRRIAADGCRSCQQACSMEEWKSGSTSNLGLNTHIPYFYPTTFKKASSSLPKILMPVGVVGLITLNILVLVIGGEINRVIIRARG